MYSYINPIIYSEIQKLSLIIAFAPEFFYQILKFCYRHSTIHFVFWSIKIVIVIVPFILL